MGANGDLALLNKDTVAFNTGDLAFIDDIGTVYPGKQCIRQHIFQQLQMKPHQQCPVLQKDLCKVALCFKIKQFIKVEPYMPVVHFYEEVIRYKGCSSHCLFLYGNHGACQYLLRLYNRLCKALKGDRL